MLLGAGRAKVDDELDYGAGLVLHRKVGDSVEQGAPLATLYYNDARNLEEARSRLLAAFTISDGAPPENPLIRQILT